MRTSAAVQAALAASLRRRLRDARARASTPAAPPELPATASAPIAVAPDWWKAFNDPRLDALVDEALRDNRDLARAMARIDESRAALRLAQSERWPVVSAGASGRTPAQSARPGPCRSAARRRG